MTSNTCTEVLARNCCIAAKLCAPVLIRIKLTAKSSIPIDNNVPVIRCDIESHAVKGSR